jgi:hypothetical protein
MQVTRKVFLGPKKRRHKIIGVKPQNLQQTKRYLHVQTGGETFFVISCIQQRFNKCVTAMNQHILIICKIPHLLQASTVIEKHNATRNTAFTSAPNTSARAQPNVFFDHFFGDICKDKSLLYIHKTYG